MEDVVVRFDPKPDKINGDNCKLTLKARSENIVKLPTKSMGHGLISKRKLTPGVYLAESLTKEMNGRNITSIVNTREEDITLDLPQVLLEAVDDSEEAMTEIHTAVPIEVAGRLSKLREQLRTDQLNVEEHVSLVKICEKYHDIFQPHRDTLTCTTATEHALTTPTIDPSRAITTKSYRNPEIHKEVLKKTN
jgi:hypothetical protein